MTQSRLDEAFSFAWSSLQSIAASPAASVETQLQVQRTLDDLRAFYPQATEGLDTPRRINGKCSWCGEPMEVPDRPQGGGRTKRFCSEAHKQAAHRAAQQATSAPADPAS